MFEELIDGEQAGLHHQRVERRLAQQQVDAPLDQRVDLFVVGGHHLVERGAAVAGIIHIAGDRELLVGRANRAGHEPQLLGRPQVHFIDRPAGERHRGQVQLPHAVLQMKIGHGHARGPEGVGLDDIGAGFQILPVNLLDGSRLSDRQDVDEVLEIVRMIGELTAAKIGLAEHQRVHHGSHGAVQNQNPLAQKLFEGLAEIRACGF